MATTYVRKTIVVVDAVCYRCKGTGAFAGKPGACFACHGAGHMKQNRPVEEVRAPVQAAVIAGRTVRELHAAIDAGLWEGMEEPIEVTDEGSGEDELRDD